MSHDVNSKIQASRKELLDIGLRNNLINFKKTSKTLALKVEDIASVFEALYVEEKLLSFDAAKESGKSRSAQEVDDELNEADFADDALLQAFTEEESLAHLGY